VSQLSLAEIRRLQTGQHIIIIFFNVNLGRSSRGGRQNIIITNYYYYTVSNKVSDRPKLLNFVHAEWDEQEGLLSQTDRATRCQ